MLRRHNARLLAAVGGGAFVLPLLASSPAAAASPTIVFNAQAPQYAAKISELMKSFCDPSGALDIRPRETWGRKTLEITPNPRKFDTNVFPMRSAVCEVEVLGNKKLNPLVVKDQWRKLFEQTNRGSTESTVVSNESVMNSRTLGFTFGLSGDKTWPGTPVDAVTSPVKAALTAAFNYQEVTQTTKTKEVRHPVAPGTRSTVYQVPDVTEYALQVRIVATPMKGVVGPGNLDVNSDGNFRYRVDNLITRDIKFDANSPVYEVIEQKLR
ncbi:hypothetical protein ACFP1Z_32025 [Streptomyces gamaensis]|uniref:Uncharacterized protein n=1 Tax=Streptomyces gamaensis TaxID=1763542 RepID=A0ABW0ZBR6_9ACTN